MSSTTRDGLRRFQSARRHVLRASLIATFLALLFVSADADREIRLQIQSFGGFLIMIAIFGRIWCILYIGGRKGAEIVTAGPYSVTRNPLYVFSSIGALGVGLLTGSVIVGLAFGVVTWLALLIVISEEEKFLEARFGEPYRIYMRKVPRFFPHPWLFKDSKTLTVRPRPLYRTFRDGLVFVLAYPFFEIVERLQGTGMLPVLLRLH